MFSPESTPVMFIGLLVAFSWCTLWSLYELTRQQSGTQRISNALHLVMSVVMLLMVARPTWAWLTAVIPTAGWAVVFAAATLWFIWLAVTRGETRAHFSSHAAMFAAMAWHLAAMAAMSAAKHGSHQNAGGGRHDMGMGSGHSMGGQPMTEAWWFALVGLPLMTYLLASALFALWRVVKPAAPAASALGHSCAPAPTRAWEPRLEALSAFAMAAGMFWMSLGLLAPIIPAARALLV